MPSNRLQAILDGARGPTVIELKPGHYFLTPVPYLDLSCGNCEDPTTPVQATRGLFVSGSEIRIRARKPGTSTIHTRAGYGILFEGCQDCSIEGVNVTGGARDEDGKATDAAIVARNSVVRIAGCRIHDNIGDPATVRGTVAGVIGVAGREGAGLLIEDCAIERNSWDGVALYRGSFAIIRRNVIDGVDAASGDTIGGGRGVGIGLTWDARARVDGNLVRRYWKGIGVFVDARAEIVNNVVEDILTWGIALWGAEKGTAAAEISRNVIYRTGACGAMIAREDSPGVEPGSFTDNFLVMTGQNDRYDSGEPYCRQEALAEHTVPRGFRIDGNVFYGNREPGGRPGSQDLGSEEFSGALKLLLNAPGPALSRSRFQADFR